MGFDGIIERIPVNKGCTDSPPPFVPLADRVTEVEKQVMELYKMVGELRDLIGSIEKEMNELNYKIFGK